MTVISITTSNICGNPIRGVRYVRSRIWLASKFTGINFGQEIDPQNYAKGRGRPITRSYAQLWRSGMAKRGKNTYGSVCEVPISMPKHWHVQSSHVHLVHKGRAKVSPNRYINEVRAIRNTGEMVCFLACHPVSKGYGGKRVSAKLWRHAMLKEYFTRLDQLVTDAHNDGYTVIFGGDMNWPSAPAVIKGQVTLAHSGLDWLWAVPAQGWHIRVLKRTKIPPTRFMDHPILNVKFTLDKA